MLDEDHQNPFACLVAYAQNCGCYYCAQVHRTRTLLYPWKWSLYLHVDPTVPPSPWQNACSGEQDINLRMGFHEQMTCNTWEHIQARHMKINPQWKVNVSIFIQTSMAHNSINAYLYLPECREILWFSGGSAAAAGYGGYYGGYGGYYGGGGGYGEISTFVCLFVCEQYSGKTPWWISTKLGGGVRYGPRIMPLNFGLGPHPPKNKFRENIYIFFLHFYMF